MAARWHQGVGWLVSAGGRVRWGGAGQGAFLQCQIGVQVDLDGVGLLVSQSAITDASTPERNSFTAVE